MRKTLRNQAGMTLIELLIVIVIIGILMGFLFPKFGGFTNSSQINSVDTDLRVMKSSIQQHYIDNRDKDLTIAEFNKYSDFQVVQQSSPGVNPLHFTTSSKKDPWGNPYHIYVSNTGSRYVTFLSHGPDTQPGLSASNPGDDILLLFYPRLQ